MAPQEKVKIVVEDVWGCDGSSFYDSGDANVYGGGTFDLVYRTMPLRQKDLKLALAYQGVTTGGRSVRRAYEVMKAVGKDAFWEGASVSKPKRIKLRIVRKQSSRPRHIPQKKVIVTGKKPSEADKDKHWGKLSVLTHPWSKIFIDGKFLRNTPFVNHKLKPGRYRLELKGSVLGDFAPVKLVIRPGKHTKIIRTLGPY